MAVADSIGNLSENMAGLALCQAAIALLIQDFL